MNKLLFALLLLSFPFALTAGTVRLSGTAPGFEERKLSVLRFEDPYSKKIAVIKSSFTDADAKFNLEFELEETAEILIRIGLTTARMYAQPGADYELIIPNDGSQVRAIHERSYLDVDLLNVSAEDVNVRIAAFNNAYDRFFSDNYVEIAKASYPGAGAFKNSRKEKLDKLIVKNDSLSANSSYDGLSFKQMVRQFADSMSLAYADESPFVRTYALYSLADIEMNSGAQKDSLFGRYLSSPLLPVTHPQFAEFATVFYFRFLEDLDRWGAEPKPSKAINDEQNIDALYASFESSDFSQDKEHKSLAAIVGLKDAWYGKGRYNKAAVLGMLGQMNASNSSDWSISIAQNLREEFQVRKKGESMPEVELLNIAGERTNWEEFKGEMVYVIAVAEWSTSSMEQLTVLSKIAEKYSRDARFVVLSMDAEYSDFKNFVSRNHRNKWTFLYAMSDPLIREKLDIWSLPSSFLISPDGKWQEAHMPMPSEGLEAYFYKMNEKAKKDQRIKVWDD